MPENLPLFNQNILLTRPVHQCDELKRLFEEQGATVFLQPTIEILPPSDWRSVDEAITTIFEYDILIFASSNGVHSFFERVKVVLRENFEKNAGNLPLIVATGLGTSETLARYGVKDVLLPSERYDAEGIIALLTGQQIAGKRVLLVRGNRGRTLLPDELVRLGATVEQVCVYQSVDLTTLSPQIASLVQCGKIHWVTVTSSAIGRSLVRMFGDDLRHTKLASISPITSQTLTECGFPPTVEAVGATLPALVNAVIGF
ncbi:MAG: uroporphyrinogen-III synthase [Planctomycetaceae bacterium]|nr:uroporphyrinogen-III synthase [Planctomycetaceae bacterium]